MQVLEGELRPVQAAVISAGHGGCGGRAALRVRPRGFSPTPSPAPRTGHRPARNDGAIGDAAPSGALRPAPRPRFVPAAVAPRRRPRPPLPPQGGAAPLAAGWAAASRDEGAIARAAAAAAVSAGPRDARARRARSRGAGCAAGSCAAAVGGDRASPAGTRRPSGALIRCV